MAQSDRSTLFGIITRNPRVGAGAKQRFVNDRSHAQFVAVVRDGPEAADGAVAADDDGEGIAEGIFAGEGREAAPLCGALGPGGGTGPGGRRWLAFIFADRARLARRFKRFSFRLPIPQFAAI